MDLKTLIKKFSVGFVPLLVFIIADEFFGTRIGLIVAVAVGLLEFTYYLFRYRQVEKFVLFDTALIIILGGFSILLDSDLLFKLKPALIEFILAILLGIHAFSAKPILLLMGNRYFKDIEFNSIQLQMMRRTTQLLFFVVIFHVALVVYSAYMLSNEAWAFISGGLFYLVFIAVLVAQFIYMRFIKRREAPVSFNGVDEELFDIVSENGKITGRATRSSVHGNPRLLHPVVHIHIFNKRGQLYLQKRAKTKDVQPGKWDTGVGGHISSGESVEAALHREAEEELNIKNGYFEPLYRYVMRNDYESELVHTFRTINNGPFRINKNEIDFGRFWSINEIKNNLGKGIFTPNFEQEFDLLQKVIRKAR